MGTELLTDSPTSVERRDASHRAAGSATWRNACGLQPGTVFRSGNGREAPRSLAVIDAPQVGDAMLGDDDLDVRPRRRHRLDPGDDRGCATLRRRPESNDRQTALGSRRCCTEVGVATDTGDQATRDPLDVDRSVE